MGSAMKVSYLASFTAGEAMTCANILYDVFPRHNGVANAKAGGQLFGGKSCTPARH